MEAKFLESDSDDFNDISPLFENFLLQTSKSDFFEDDNESISQANQEERNFENSSINFYESEHKDMLIPETLFIVSDVYYQRYKGMTNEIILRLLRLPTYESNYIAHLKGRWLNLDIKSNEPLFILSEFKKMHLNQDETNFNYETTIDNKNGFVVLWPFLMIQATKLSQSIYCMRKSLLTPMVPYKKRNVDWIMDKGKIAHSVIDDILLNKIEKTEVQERTNLLINENIIRKGDQGVPMNEKIQSLQPVIQSANLISEGIKNVEATKKIEENLINLTKKQNEINEQIKKEIELKKTIPINDIQKQNQIKEIIQQKVIENNQLLMSIEEKKNEKRKLDILASNSKSVPPYGCEVYGEELFFFSLNFGYYGIIDIVSFDSKKNKYFPIEMKSGKSLNKKPKKYDEAQLMAYITMMKENFKDKALDSGKLFYMEDNHTVDVKPGLADDQSLAILRNDITEHFVHGKVPPMLNDRSHCERCQALVVCQFMKDIEDIEFGSYALLDVHCDFNNDLTKFENDFGDYMEYEDGLDETAKQLGIKRYQFLSEDKSNNDFSYDSDDVMISNFYNCSNNIIDGDNFPMNSGGSQDVEYISKSEFEKKNSDLTNALNDKQSTENEGIKLNSVNDNSNDINEVEIISGEINSIENKEMSNKSDLIIPQKEIDNNQKEKTKSNSNNTFFNDFYNAFINKPPSPKSNEKSPNTSQDLNRILTPFISEKSNQEDKYDVIDLSFTNDVIPTDAKISQNGTDIFGEDPTSYGSQNEANCFGWDPIPYRNQNVNCSGFSKETNRLILKKRMRNFKWSDNYLPDNLSNRNKTPEEIALKLRRDASLPPYTPDQICFYKKLQKEIMNDICEEKFNKYLELANPVEERERHGSAINKLKLIQFIKESKEYIFYLENINNPNLAIGSKCILTKNGKPPILGIGYISYLIPSFHEVAVYIGNLIDLKEDDSYYCLDLINFNDNDPEIQNLILLFAYNHSKLRKITSMLIGHSPSIDFDSSYDNFDDLMAISLNEDQKKAFFYSITSKDYSIISGCKNSGKTTLIASLIQKFKIDQKSIMVVSPSAASIQSLCNLLGLPSDCYNVCTKFSFFVCNQIWLSSTFDILIVDDCEKIKLTDLIEMFNSCDKYILCGDIYQAQVSEVLSIFSFADVENNHVNFLRTKYEKSQKIHQLENSLIYNDSTFENRSNCLKINLDLKKLDEIGKNWLNKGLSASSYFFDTSDFIDDNYLNSESDIVATIAISLVACGLNPESIGILCYDEKSPPLIANSIKLMLNSPEIHQTLKEIDPEAVLKLIEIHHYSCYREKVDFNFKNCEVLLAYFGLHEFLFSDEAFVALLEAKQRIYLVGRENRIEMNPFFKKLIKLLDGKEKIAIDELTNLQ